MTVDLPNLLRLLDEETALYAELLTLARRKTDLLTSRAPVTAVESLVAEEESHIRKLAALETARLETMVQVAGALHLQPRGLTLKDLSFSVDAETGARLRTTARTTLDLVGQLKAVNQLNSRLISQELAFVSFSLDVLTNFDGRSTYSNPAAGPAYRPVSGCASPALLDTRA